MEPLRIVVYGEAGTGKGAILVRLLSNIFRENPNKPLVKDSFVHNVNCNGELVQLYMDTVDSIEANISLISPNGVILVYSCTSRESFEEAKAVVEKLKAIPTVLVANKIDLTEERIITKEEGQTLAQTIGCPYFEVSAKINVGISFPFQSLVEEIMKRTNSVPKNNTGNGKCLIM